MLVLKSASSDSLLDRWFTRPDLKAKNVSPYPIEVIAGQQYPYCFFIMDADAS